jgi:hypothetical protein
LVVANPALADITTLRFRDPDDFHAGHLHAHALFWEPLIDNYGSLSSALDFKQVIQEGVRVEQFFQHFKGSFKGKDYDSPTPPALILHNSPSCSKFHPFVSATLLDWVAAGVLTFQGSLGECVPPSFSSSTYS